MKTKQQPVLDSLHRSKDFTVTHAAVLGAITGLEGCQKLDAAILAIETSINDQGTYERLMTGEMGTQKALIEHLIAEHMTPIRLFARAKLDGVPDFTALTRPAATNSVNVVVRDARSMATAASKYMDQLTAGGFPPDAPQQILGLLDQIEASKTERNRLRVARTRSTKSIEANLALGREGVNQLNAIIIKQFASDKAFLTAWRSASRVYSGTKAAATAPVIPATPIATAPSTVAPVQPVIHQAA